MKSHGSCDSGQQRTRAALHLQLRVGREIAGSRSRRFHSVVSLQDGGARRHAGPRLWVVAILTACVSSQHGERPSSSRGLIHGRSHPIPWRNRTSGQSRRRITNEWGTGPREHKNRCNRCRDESLGSRDLARCYLARGGAYTAASGDPRRAAIFRFLRVFRRPTLQPHRLAGASAPSHSDFDGSLSGIPHKP